MLDKPAGLPVDAPRDGSLSVESHLASLTFGFARWPLPVLDSSACPAWCSQRMLRAWWLRRRSGANAQVTQVTRKIVKSRFSFSLWPADKFGVTNRFHNAQKAHKSA